jgi:hypothetical protein
MGMELILQYGLKFFVNKFKRKGSGLDHYAIPDKPVGQVRSSEDIDAGSQELIFLLSKMIQTAGKYHGTKQENYS